MNTSIKTRVVALVCSVLISLASVYLIAGYAYPEAAAVVVAATTSR